MMWRSTCERPAACCCATRFVFLGTAWHRTSGVSVSLFHATVFRVLMLLLEAVPEGVWTVEGMAHGVQHEACRSVICRVPGRTGAVQTCANGPHKTFENCLRVFHGAWTPTKASTRGRLVSSSNWKPCRPVAGPWDALLTI